MYYLAKYVVKNVTLNKTICQNVLPLRDAESGPWCKECGNAMGEKSTLFPGFQLFYSETFHACGVIVFGHLQGGGASWGADIST